MRRSIGLTLAASIAVFAAAPTAAADISSAKGKRICKEAGEVHDSAASVRVNPRDIRSTETSYIYRVRLTGADDEVTHMICSVNKETGEAALEPGE
mgnify:CR=1 FL=1